MKYKKGDKICHAGFPGEEFEFVEQFNGPKVKIKRMADGIIGMADESDIYFDGLLDLEEGWDQLDLFDEPTEKIDPCTAGCHIRSDDPMQLPEKHFKWHHICKKCGVVMDEFKVHE